MNLFRQGSQPIGEIRAGTCFACHTGVAPQARVAVERGQAPHNCRGCQRWLVALEPAPG